MEKLGSPDPGPTLVSAGPNSDAKKAEAEGEEAAAGGSSTLFRCACVRRWLPPAYREELCHVLRLTGPLVSGRGDAACSSVITVLRSDVWPMSGLVMPPAAHGALSHCLDWLLAAQIICLNPAHRDPASLAGRL